jgi:hypothetical protein
MEKVIELVLAVVIGLMVYAILAALPVMLLWNALFPELFGLQTINFWQALGLLILCGALFKSRASSSSK